MVAVLAALLRRPFLQAMRVTLSPHATKSRPVLLFRVSPAVAHGKLLLACNCRGKQAYVYTKGRSRKAECIFFLAADACV